MVGGSAWTQDVAPERASRSQPPTACDRPAWGGCPRAEGCKTAPNRLRRSKDRDGYADEEKNTFGKIAYLFLDEALGEYAIETRVGFIEFQACDSKYFPQWRPPLQVSVVAVADAD